MMLSVIITTLFVIIADSLYSKRKKKEVPWIYWVALLLSTKMLIITIPDTFEKVWKALLLGACLRSYQNSIVDVLWGAILAFLATFVYEISYNYIPDTLNVPFLSLCQIILQRGG
jgi:hypothetical protein